MCFPPSGPKKMRAPRTRGPPRTLPPPMKMVARHMIRAAPRMRHQGAAEFTAGERGHLAWTLSSMARCRTRRSLPGPGLEIPPARELGLDPPLHPPVVSRMLVTPLPIFALRFAVGAIPVTVLLVPFLLKPVPVRPCFALIPLV